MEGLELQKTPHFIDLGRGRTDADADGGRGISANRIVFVERIGSIDRRQMVRTRRGAEGEREEKEGGFRPIGATSTVCKAIPAGNADVGAPFPLFDALLSLLENWFVLALLPC